MKAGQYVFLALLVAACLAAVGFCLWSLVIYGSIEMAVVGAVILLALAQLASFVSRISDERRAGRHGREFVQTAADLGRDLREVRRRLSQLEDMLRAKGEGAGGDLARQVASLDRAVEALAVRLDGTPRKGEAGGRSHAGEPGESEQGEEGRPDFDLFLEPVVRLESGRTTYYRARFRLGGGARPEARDEARFIARVVALLRHLDRRGRAVGIFCRLSQEAFADGAFLRRLVKYLRRNEDVAGKLVVEITQGDLAGLSQEGMRGLAWLAELGATFSLARARPGSLDLAALRDLGFQFLDLDLAALASAEQRDPSRLKALAEEAERHALTLIAGPVGTADDLALARSLASLAHGRRFAPPRRVRADFGDADEAHAAAA
jgi:cyclic-di-GMP phosphodiesterase TipF (flagellum assembly factor)